MGAQTVKGFSDYTGPDAIKRRKIMDIVRRNFELFGFEPAETPSIESREMIKGENEADQAVRDTFKLEDRGERKLALRYEFTFQLKRIAKNQKLPYKRYQIGSVFRDEPIRQGRTREFIQCDADIVGCSVKDEAEILALGKKVFEELGIKTKIYVNDRKLIDEVLESYEIKERFRKQVIRELDKLDKLSSEKVAKNLEEFEASNLVKVFKEKESFFEKFSNYSRIKELKKLCALYGVDIEFRPYLARGFSYYVGTVFEFWVNDLNVSLVGGGSYKVGETSSCGISFGLEPISLIADVKIDSGIVLVISLNQDENAIRLSKDLRDKGIKITLVTDKTLQKSLEYANSKKITKVLIVGSEEVKVRKVKFKDMASGKESMVSEEEVVDLLVK